VIPVSLTLRNFLSYGEDARTLDFSDFRVACITGKNGHGKSALFDAMTWALWGEARKASSDRKPDEGLLRIGATDLRVEFVFDLDGQRFRVARGYRKTARSGSSTLELQIFDGGSDRFRSLSESGSIRKTQSRIDKLIRVGYDTFVNSAFILQGRVDAFTRRSPSDRKAILADILELSRYDALAARARDHARRAETESKIAQEALLRVAEAEQRQAEVADNLTAARTTLEAAETASDEIERELAAAQQQIAKLEADRAQRTALSTELTSQNARKTQATEEKRVSDEAQADLKTKLGKKDRILNDLNVLSDLRAEEKRLGDQQKQVQVSRVEQAGHQAEIDTARAKVEDRQAHWSGVAADLRSSIEAFGAQLERQPEIEKSLVALSRLRAQVEELSTLPKQRESVDSRRREVESIFNARRAEIQVEIETCMSRRRDLQILLDKRTELERVYNDARQHLETFEALNEEMDRVKREGTEAQQTEDRLEERLNGLSQRHQQLIAQTEQLTAEDDQNCPLCGSELNEHHRSEVLAQISKDVETVDWELETASRDRDAAKARRDTCRSAYQTLRDRVHPLGDAPRRFSQAEAELGQVAGVDESLQSLVERIQSLKTAAKDFETTSDVAIELQGIRKQADQLKAGSDRLDALQKQIGELAPCEIEKAKLDGIQDELDKAQAALPKAVDKHAQASLWLTEKRYAPDAQTRLAELREAELALGYDEEAHRAIQTRVEALKPVEAEYQALLSAERDLTIAQAAATALCDRLGEIDGLIDRITGDLQRFETVEQDLEISTDKLRAISEKQDQQRSSRDVALRQVATLERDAETNAELISKKPELTEKQSQHDKDVTVYRELSKAFGRDGIQALLIDQAIPELQDEANRILSRLTANGTQVSLESLGELKSGGTKETLDIRISDELGERRYELYSGGEAFRVDFAIRIALSKLLASRSGTPLQTLVIDEGFGTQDEQGLTQLIEAIQTISDEFEKVLVITHVDAIKNAFPVRIEVVKHPDSGSTFTVET